MPNVPPGTKKNRSVSLVWLLKKKKKKKNLKFLSLKRLSVDKALQLQGISNS